MNNMKSREQIIKERSMPYEGPGPTTWSNLQGNTGKFDISLRPSKTLGGDKSGVNEQARKFGGDNVFKEFE